MYRTLTALAVLFAWPAAAQIAPQTFACFSTTIVERTLKAAGQSVYGYGVTKSGNIVQFWKNEPTGRWTIIVQLPDGRSCSTGGGTDWETIVQGEPV